MASIEKRLNEILRYLSQNKGGFPDIQEICNRIDIPFNPKYKIQLEHDDFIENIGETANGDGFIITKQGEYFIEIEGGYGSKIDSKQKRSLKSFFYHSYVRGILIVIIGGILLIFLIRLIFSDTQNIEEKGSEILIIPNNYKIHMQNNEYPKLDTLNIDITYRGIDAVISKDFEMLEYKFDNALYFYKDPELFIKPELEILETFISNPLIDSNNRKPIVGIQIKRKMIFNGIREAYFEPTDKLQIGYLKMIAKYESNNKKKQDTLNVKIFLEK